MQQKPYQINKYLGCILVRYSGQFLKWTRKELKQMDQWTRKLMTMHKVLHPRNDVDRLYVSRKKGGRVLISIEDCVDASIQRLEDFKEKRGEGLITVTRNNTDITKTNWTTITRKQKREEKQLCGRFKRLISKTSHEKTRTRLRKRNLKRETEYLLLATQNNTIRTNHIKARIDKTQQNSKCRWREFAKLWTLLPLLTIEYNWKKMKRRISTRTLLQWKKTVEHESNNHTNCDWYFWYSHQRIIKGTGGLGNKRTSGDHPNDSIIENGQNTEKSPVDLRKLAVTQTPVKDHQLTLMWKTVKE